MIEHSSVAANLDEITRLLGSPFLDADSVFLAIGNDLGMAIDTFASLTATFDGLSGELDSEELREAAEHLREVARSASGIADALGGEKGNLAALMAAIQRVGGAIARLHKTVGAIAVLSVNAQIAAAHLDREGEDFSVFTKEIGRLARAVQASVTHLGRDCASLDALVRSAVAKQGEFGKRYGEALRAITRHLETSLGQVDAHRIRAAGLVTEIGQQSKRIGDEIAATVMALQVNDSTRQRVEHVAFSLDLLSVGLSPRRGDGAGTGAAGWRMSVPEESLESFTALVCRLQSAQMARAMDDFGAEVRRISCGMGGLARDAHGIVALGTEVFGTGGKGGGSFLEDLGGTVERASGLIRDCQTARSEVDRVGDAVSRTLTSLAAQVDGIRRIEIDMRLLGLNTTFKCGRLGEKGRTLSAVAQEFRGYANRTVEDARALTGVLEEVIAAANALSRQQQGQGAEVIAALEARTGASLSRLDRIGARLDQALGSLGNEGERISKLLLDTAGRITVHDDIDKALRPIRARLDHIAGADGREEADPAEREALTYFSKHYTMAVEREIHRTFAAPGREVDEDSPGITGAPEEFSLDDLFL